MKYAIILIIALGLVVAGISNSFTADASTSGSDPIFMKVPGITGETTAEGFTGDIELNSFSFGVENTATVSGLGISAGKANFAPFAVAKIMDSASPKLFGDVASGARLTQVDIYLAKTTSLGLQTYAHYILRDVVISSYSVASGGDTPQESISINFATIQFEFTPINPDGSKSPPISVAWDIASNSVPP